MTVHADVNAKDQYGLAPVINAAFAGNMGCVNALIAASADLDANDPEGMTDLRLATGKGLDAPCVRVPIAAGATKCTEVIAKTK
jgi:ankyrin repeat protein